MCELERSTSQIPEETTMSAPISPKTRNTDTMMKLFNEAIARLRLITTRILIRAYLLAAIVVTLSAPIQAAEPLALDEPGARLADTFVILLSCPYKPVTSKQVMDGLNFLLNLVYGFLL